MFLARKQKTNNLSTINFKADCKYTECVIKLNIMETSYCRLCAELTPSSKLFDLSDSERSREVVGKLTRLKQEYVYMFRDNVLPKTVCFLCLDSLYRSVAFLDKVESSQDILKNIFVVKDIKQELVNSSSSDDDDSQSDALEEHIIETKKSSIKAEQIKCCHESTIKFRKLKKRTQVKQERVIDSDPKLTWDDYNWMCAFCKTQFPNVEELKSHSMEYHDSCTAYKCIDCNIRKLKLDPFLAHIMRHRKSLRKYCHVCNIRLTHRRDSEKHRRLHIKHKNVCAGCHSSFQCAKDLNEHKNKYYTDKRATRVLRPPGDEDLVCNVCDKKFKTRAILQAHILIHTDRRRDHTCDVCGKCFYNKDTLTSHLVVHDETRPYQCEICKFAFKTIGQLRMHVGTHDGERPFACDQCGKRFRLRKNLTSHMITHTDQLPHVCQYCNKAFRFKTILNQHIRQHTGVRPYSCNVCQRPFTNWSNYNKHMKRRHGMEMAKKKHTPVGVFPINPVTGEVIISPTTEDTEEWKKSVLQRKLVRHKSVTEPAGSNGSTILLTPSEHTTNSADNVIFKNLDMKFEEKNENC